MDYRQIKADYAPPLDRMETCVRYFGWVSTEPPDLETLPRAPADGDITRWITTWRPVHFRTGGTWHVGVLRAWIHLTDGRWVAHIDHAGAGMHDGWQQSTWAVFNPALILPVDPVPPGYSA